MLKRLLHKLEDPKRPLLGPNLKALKFWGLLLPENFIMRQIYILLHLSVILFTASECVDVWFVKSNITLLLNNLKITMLATVSVCKISTFLFWQNDWKKIIGYVIEADIMQRKTNDIIKQTIIKKFTKYCRKITYMYWCLMYTTVIIVMVQPIIKYFSSPVYRENVRNGNETYLQVVSSWVPFDKNTITGYLIASVIQSYGAIYGGGWITSYDTNAMVIMVFFRGELELLRRDCANMFGTESSPVTEQVSKERLKDCHRRYVALIEHARLFDSCLSPIMLLYMFVCSVMLCVTAYQITIETNPMQRFLSAEYLVFGVAQLFIYCWHSNDVLYASQDLMLGPYESTWWMHRISYRKNIFILIAQFRKRIVFTAGPFTELTVPTFINV
uniref:Odorant receptor n=1 Tax=Streltzoviella insularis TaxID=1206366 RepID=A0A7D5YXV9_9NEOP|nr:odorant receptor 26 [Streltzoviella insularis]